MTFDEFYGSFSIRKLAQGESIKVFSCGDEDLDDFILNDAPLYSSALLAVTYVIERNTDKEVVAYFSLANDRIAIKDFPSNTEFNKFRKYRFVNDKRLTNYPSVKLCRFAISTSAKGQHLGSILLDFMKWYFVQIIKQVAVSLPWMPIGQQSRFIKRMVFCISVPKIQEKPLVLCSMI